MVASWLGRTRRLNSPTISALQFADEQMISFRFIEQKDMEEEMLREWWLTLSIRKDKFISHK